MVVKLICAHDSPGQISEVNEDPRLTYVRENCFFFIPHFAASLPPSFPPLFFEYSSVAPFLFLSLFLSLNNFIEIAKDRETKRQRAERERERERERKARVQAESRRKQKEKEGGKINRKKHNWGPIH